MESAKKLKKKHKNTVTSHIAVVQEQTHATFVSVSIKMLDSASVERRGAANQAVNNIALLQQQLGQIRSILACTSDSQRQNTVRA